MVVDNWQVQEHGALYLKGTWTLWTDEKSKMCWISRNPTDEKLVAKHVKESKENAKCK